MARREPTLIVLYSPEARDDLFGIWLYNLKHGSPHQADLWEKFLKAKTQDLATSYENGKPVDSFPLLRYVIARKRPKAHGHIIVYQVDEAAGTINILRFFHTRQDWENEI